MKGLGSLLLARVLPVDFCHFAASLLGLTVCPCALLRAAVDFSLLP